MEHKNSMGSRVQIRKIRKGTLFPTLFSKLFTLYISILVGTLLFFFVVFSTNFQQYFVEYTQDMMVKQAQMIAKEYKSIGEFKQAPNQVIDQIFYKIQILDSYLDATTWLVDKYNRMIVVSEDSDTAIDNRTIANKYAIQEVFKGNVIKIETGFEEYFATPVLTIGYPIEILGNIEYALFIHTPMPQILKTIDEVRIIILKVVSVTGLIILGVIYLISRQMTKPLKEMNEVAKKIANGEFDKRISIEAGDEIGELAASLNYMARELDKIEENRKSFIANVSHDMRSPLTSIQGFVTAILDGTIPPEKQEKYLNIVLNESQRMIKMTNDILELNKLEEGNLPLKKMEFDIHEMIKDILANFEQLIREKDIQVNLLLEHKEEIVFADPEKIVRVIQNLLDNAFKFVNIKGTIEIETVCNANKVWVYVKNSGAAIPLEEQHSIWERFYKADLSRGKDKKGMGIGLVIVKEIIKQHNEEIKISSNEGEMVQFYFSLPMVK